MFPRTETSNRVVGAIWWAGVFISVVLLIRPHGWEGIDLSRRSPFDNTGSGHAEQWVFLNEAAEHVPRGASFTIVAPDRETEMSLYMMSVGLLPDALPFPSSYYGRATTDGESARFVLVFSDHRDHRPEGGRPIAVDGGQLVDRQARPP